MTSKSAPSHDEGLGTHRGCTEATSGVVWRRHLYGESSYNVMMSDCSLFLFYIKGESSKAKHRAG